jgi:hypothetical protein
MPCCYDLHWLNNTRISLCFKITWTHEQFSPQMVLVVLILDTCVLDFYVVSGQISLSSWVFLWSLICGLVQALFLSLAVNFEFFDRYFPVTALGLDQFSGAYPNKLLLWWCSVTDNSPV